jgi:hypothetical protein
MFTARAAARCRIGDFGSDAGEKIGCCPFAGAYRELK